MYFSTVNRNQLSGVIFLRNKEDPADLHRLLRLLGIGKSFHQLKK